MLQKVEKVGADLTVKIPSILAEKCGISGECQVNLRIQDSRIIIETADQSFTSLMASWNDMNEEQPHSEMFFG